MNSPIPEIFELIIEKCSLGDLFRFELVSKYYKHIIRNHSFITIKIRLKNAQMCRNVLTQYNFKNLDLSKTNISDAEIMLLNKCQILDLCECLNITDLNMHMLSNCQNLNLSRTKITDAGLKFLTRCH